MASSKIWASVMVALVVALMAATTRVAEGQPTATCASKLTPCANYLNSTNPPSSCCDPLREAVTQDLPCLCTLFNTPGLLTSLGINSADALQLPGRCNIPGDLNACSNASAPSSPSPPATPGSDSNGDRIVATGMLSILLFWASMMLY